MRDQQNPSTVAELMAEAAAALIRRDGARLEELERISEGWMQTDYDRIGQRMMLQAMAEAAYLLEDEPSGIEIEDEDEG